MKVYMKQIRIVIMILLNLVTFVPSGLCQKISPIVQDKVNRTVTLSTVDGDLILRINYSEGCVLDQVVIKGTEVTRNMNPVFTGIKSGDSLYTSMRCNSVAVVTTHNNSLNISAIKYGTAKFSIEEEWSFNVNEKEIQWQINRRYLNEVRADENYFPCWQFNSMQIWDGALLDNGGVAWNR